MLAAGDGWQEEWNGNFLYLLSMEKKEVYVAYPFSV